MNRNTLKIKTSLLISTYNWPEALELVLLSIEKQTVLPNEVLIADDGSTDDTKQIIEDFKKRINLKVNHVWHEDKGFRKSIILNKALAKADGEYIIQSDGDCILDSYFVEDHINFSEPNVYLYGSRVSILKDFVKVLFKNKNISFNYFSKGISSRSRAIRIPLFSSFYKPKNELSRKLRGCNVSYWKKDFIKVNGFNEDMTGWGREDSELIARIMNIGILGKRIRYSGIVFHLWHKINSKHNFNKNDSIQKKVIEKKIQWCENGVNKYL